MRFLHIFTLPCTAEAFFDGQFMYLQENGIETLVIANSEFDPEFVKRNHLTELTVPISRSINPAADIMAILRVRKIIRKENIDGVVGHTPKGAMIAMLAGILAGSKIRIYYRHGLIYTTASGLRRMILKSVERMTASCATHIVNVSPSLNSLALKDRLNSEAKQCVIGAGTCGGIDANNLFNPEHVSKPQVNELRASLGISKQEFVIGFCGRICKEKGIRELIDGFSIFQGKHQNSKLLLVGGYDMRDILPEEYKRKIAENPAIIHTGPVVKSILPLYYSLMDTFVFPSYREGFGMCVIEASAMEVSVLVSRSHGCVDSISEGITGEYIEPSPIAIADGLEIMLDEKKRGAYGENGRKWVVNNFDHRVLWPIVKDFYSECIRNQISNEPI